MYPGNYALHGTDAFHRCLRVTNDHAAFPSVKSHRCRAIRRRCSLSFPKRCVCVCVYNCFTLLPKLTQLDFPRGRGTILHRPTDSFPSIRRLFSFTQPSPFCSTCGTATAALCVAIFCCKCSFSCHEGILGFAEL